MSRIIMCQFLQATWVVEVPQLRGLPVRDPGDGTFQVLQLDKKLLPGRGSRRWWTCAALGVELVAVPLPQGGGGLKVKAWP